MVKPRDHLLEVLNEKAMIAFGLIDFETIIVPC